MPNFFQKILNTPSTSETNPTPFLLQPVVVESTASSSQSRQAENPSAGGSSRHVVGDMASSTVMLNLPEPPIPYDQISDSGIESNSREHPVLEEESLRSEPVVMAWHEPNSETTLQTGEPSTSHLVPRSTEIPDENPPEYITARWPTKPTKYSFSRLSFNSLIVVPPEDAADSRPVYHVSVGMNVLVPTSFITTVRRGGIESGEYVGDFEMGYSRRAGTVCIRNREAFIHQTVPGAEFHTKTKTHWVWYKGVQPLLTWFYVLNGPEATCRLGSHTSQSSEITLAKFTKAKKLRHPRSIPELDELEIFPEGYEHFDDILMCLLIAERCRGTPPIS